MKPLHPLTALFPLLPADELQELADDIKQHGQIEPIQIWNDQVIDGQNRQAACELAGVEPIYVEVEGDEDEVRHHIYSKNVARRHLNKGQSAMAYALIYPEDGGVGGRGKKGREINPAETARFSERRLRAARQVLKHSEDLAKMVLSGEASLDDILAAMKSNNNTKTTEPREVNVRRQIVRGQRNRIRPQLTPTETNPAETAKFTADKKEDIAPAETKRITPSTTTEDTPMPVATQSKSSNGHTPTTAEPEVYNSVAVCNNCSQYKQAQSQIRRLDEQLGDLRDEMSELKAKFEENGL